MNDLKVKMYAVVKDGFVVGMCWDSNKDEFQEENLLVEMTLENSPAYLNGTYDGTKFYERKI